MFRSFEEWDLISSVKVVKPDCYVSPEFVVELPAVAEAVFNEARFVLIFSGRFDWPPMQGCTGYSFIWG